MPRVCTICSHPDRDDIDAAVVSGASNRAIALQFGVSHMAVQRHATAHLPQAIKNSQAAKEEIRGLDIVKQLKDINAMAVSIMQESRDSKKNGMALFAMDRVIKQLELQAKLLGAIDTPQINIYMAPEWHTIRTTIVQAIAPYQDAKIAIAEALQRLEGSNARFN